MPGVIDLKAEVLNSSVCTLCGACLDWCPYLKNLDDHLVMPFDCNVKDGRCYNVCPRTFTDWHEMKESFLTSTPDSLELGAFMAIYKVKSSEPLAGQQDGGTVSSLIKTVLETDQAQVALLTGVVDHITPLSFLCNDPSSIEKAAGSRFLAAPGLRKLTEASQSGVTKLLVVGRPCQVQAIRKYQKNSPDKKPMGIISIGLFCMWSLSWRFKDYLQETFPGLGVEKITIPQHGVELATDQGTKVLPTDKVKDFIRPGCGYCLDMTSELADISVGAFEAETGWNTVIVRNLQGAALLQNALEKGYLIIKKYPEQELSGLQLASLNKKARNLKLLKEAVDNNRLPAYIDLSQKEYTEILAYAEGMVKS